LHLNWAVRYFPLLRVLREGLAPGDRLLEIGSGPYGLGKFYKHPFVGSDVTFSAPPEKPMLPVRCSGTKLPFGDASFAAVVGSDVLEHVPPEHRSTVVREALRVTRKFAVFGFPSGLLAHQKDREFHDYMKKKKIELYDWLEEHMRYPFPDQTLFEGLAPEWSVEIFGNEHIRFHDWVVRRELSGIACRLFAILLKLVPRAVEALLKLADRPPFYRIIVLVTRRHPAKN